MTTTTGPSDGVTEPPEHENDNSTASGHSEQRRGPTAQRLNDDVLNSAQAAGDDTSDRHPRNGTARRVRVRRAATPTTLQMEAVECGAAALSMILGYYGRFVSLEELRVRCDVSRDGSKASRIVQAARHYGLEATGKQMGLNALVQLRPPAVLFWNFNHFVVYEGMGRRFRKPVMLVNDPGEGHRVVSMDDFDTSFTGVVLTFETGPGFTPGGRRPRALRDVRKRLRNTGDALALVLVLSVLLAAVGLVAPAMTRAFIDSYLVPNDPSVLLPMLAVLAVAVALTPFLTGMQLNYLLRAQILSSTTATAKFMRHLMRLPVGFFDQRSPADLSRRLESNDTVAETLSRAGPSAIVAALVVVLYASLLWSYDPGLTGIGVTMALLNIGLARMVSKLRRTGVARVRIDSAKLLSTSYSGLRLIETMKATGGEHDFFRRWSAQQAALLYQEQRTEAPTTLLAGIAPTLAMVNSTLIVLVGGLRIMSGALTTGVLLAFQQLMRSFTDPLTELTRLGPQIQDLEADINRLRDVEVAAADPLFQRSEPDLTRRLGARLRVANVTFGYSKLCPPLIDKLSFEVGPGEQIALVGASGSGKSTVTRLICGLYEPWRGELRFDGLRRVDVPRSVLAASVSFVDQQIALFEGTVRDNVTLWDPTVPDEDVVTALRDAEVYDVVSERPGGIHSRVDEDGRNLSGGQRQRLDIARALAKMPSVLVLDEATSALDAETESRIYANLRRRGCACIVIAHRLSTVRESDEVLVFDAGNVVERGTHEQLVAARGVYARLLRNG